MTKTQWGSVTVMLLSGCGNQSALRPAGPQSERSATFFWLLVGVAAVVCLAVYAVLLWSALQARRRGAVRIDQVSERAMTRSVAASVTVTVLVLLAFLGASYWTGRPMTTTPANALVVEVIGRQWWWEVTYDDPGKNRRLTTANEIHVPVGRPVVLRLTSHDVIHSVWIPNLVGKRDLIPGYATSLWFRADTAGVYRGQCAEFCGHQHAKMALEVIAEPSDRFDNWYAQQLEPHDPPQDSLRRRGLDVFLTGDCVLCHSIAGTDANGKNGPTLSHLASRRMLAAASIPNTEERLSEWILDPQRIKPGVKMPATKLPASDLHALVSYLRSLQ